MRLLVGNVKTFCLLFVLYVPAIAQFAITSPTAAQVLTGWSGFPYSITQAPAATARVCYVTDAYKEPQAGENCATSAPWTLTVNTFNHLNGPHQVAATAYDALGNVIGSPTASIAFSTSNTWPANPAIWTSGPPTLTMTATTSITSTWSGVVSVTGTVGNFTGGRSLTPCLWVDGIKIECQALNASAQTFALDTTVWSNASHIVAWTVSDATGGASYPSGAYVNQIAEWSQAITFSNTGPATVNRLQTNYHELFILGTGSKTITANLLLSDGTTSTASSLAFYSQNTGVATVNSSTGVVTGVTNGNAQVRAYDPITTGTDLLCKTNPCSSSGHYTSVSHTFLSSETGNVLVISSGTGWTPGVYELTVFQDGSIGLSSCSSGSCAGALPGTISGDPGTWAEGPARTVWAFVNDQNIFPHFGSGGTILTSYNPAKSTVMHSVFQSSVGYAPGGGSAGSLPYSPGFLSDLSTTGFNTVEVASITPSVSFGGTTFTTTQATYQSTQDSYVQAQEALLASFPNLHILLDWGNNFGCCLYNTTRSIFAGAAGAGGTGTYSTPGLTYAMSAWLGNNGYSIPNTVLLSSMLDETNGDWAFKPLQGPITFTGGSTQSGLSNVSVSGGTCTVTWPAWSLNSTNHLIITGSAVTGMNNAGGSTYTATSVDSSHFTFTPCTATAGSYTSANDAGLTIEPYGTGWFASNTDYIRYTAFAQTMQQINVAGRMSVTWPNKAATTKTAIANWMGNATGPFGSNQSLSGITQMGDSATQYWSNINSYLARRGATNDILANTTTGMGDFTRLNYGAWNPDNPLVLQTAGTYNGYGFQSISCGITSFVNGLITFSSATATNGGPCAPLNIVPGVTRLSVTGSTNSALNTDYYVWNCPTTTTCNVYFASSQFTGTCTGSPIVVTFQNGDPFNPTNTTITAHGAPNQDNWGTGLNPAIPRHIGQTETFNCTGGTAMSQFNSLTFLYTFDNQTTNNNNYTFHQTVVGSGTGGTAAIISDNLYVRGRNADTLGFDSTPANSAMTVVEAMHLRACCQRAYLYTPPTQAWSPSTGFVGPNIGTFTTLFPAASNLANNSVQNGFSPRQENDLVVPTWHQMGMVSRLWTRVQKYYLQPNLDSPDCGPLIECSAHAGSYGDMLQGSNFSDGPQAVTFTLTPYLQSGQNIIRFYSPGGRSIQLSTISAGTSTDTITLESNSTAIYLFPVAFASELQQPTLSVRLADISTATDVVVRYGYDPYLLDTGNVTQDCSTGISCPLLADRNIGPIYYRIIYTASGGNVLATSDVQVIQ